MTFEQIQAAFEARLAECATHPTPIALPGRIQAKRCCCAYATPEAQAFFGYREPCCSICGGLRCKPCCTAL